MLACTNVPPVETAWLSAHPVKEEQGDIFTCTLFPFLPILTKLRTQDRFVLFLSIVDIRYNKSY